MSVFDQQMLARNFPRDSFGDIKQDEQNMARRVIDLTFPIHEGMTTVPTYWHPFVEVTILGRHGIENRETRKLVLGTHTGTHCDAPRHFIPGGKTIDMLSLDTLVGPAFMVDFSACKPLQEIGVDDFKRQLGDRRPKRLVMRFDWSDRWGKMDYYTGNPFLSQDAAQWLVSRGVKLLGMDTPMPDDPRRTPQSNVDSPIHKVFLGNEVVLVEYLCNLRELSRPEFELVVLPLKLRDGDGAPCRCVAIDQ
jgi:kynurenine formamidase